MEIDFRTNKLRKQLTDASEIKKAFGNNAKRVAARMADIKASPNLKVLMTIPAANCHLLKGDRQGEWAVDISPNHRLIFDLAHDPIPKNSDGSIDTIQVTSICICEVSDYH